MIEASNHYQSKIMKSTFQPSEAEMLASEVEGTGSSRYVGVTWPVSVRLNPQTYSYVEALSQHSKLSKNKMVQRLTEAGIDALMRELSPETAKLISDAASRVALDFGHTIEEAA